MLTVPPLALPLTYLNVRLCVHVRVHPLSPPCLPCLPPISRILDTAARILKDHRTCFHPESVNRFWGGGSQVSVPGNSAPSYGAHIVFLYHVLTQFLNFLHQLISFSSNWF